MVNFSTITVSWSCLIPKLPGWDIFWDFRTNRHTKPSLSPTSTYAAWGNQHHSCGIWRCVLVHCAKHSKKVWRATHSVHVLDNCVPCTCVYIQIAWLRHFLEILNFIGQTNRHTKSLFSLTSTYAAWGNSHHNCVIWRCVLVQHIW